LPLTHCFHCAFLSGLKAGDLEGAPALEAVRAQVVELLAGGRTLVGHGLENDLAVLHLSHPAALLRDTALHAPLQRATTGKAHKLRDLVAVHLGYAIQAPGEAHDPEEDAVGAMRLYLRVRGMAARHAVQAQRDAAALARAGGGGGWAAVARGKAAKAEEPAGAGLEEVCAESAARRTPVCWCLDAATAEQTPAKACSAAASSPMKAKALQALTNVTL